MAPTAGRYAFARLVRRGGPTTLVDGYIAALDDAFASAADRHEAHVRSQPVLADMAADSRFLTEVLARYISTAGALATKHYPVVGIPIVSKPAYSLVANCWIPLPDGSTNLSTKAIHHHGEMLLTTVTSFGPGYEHWMFTLPEPVDASLDRYKTTLISRENHPLGHTAFVDSYTAHLPLYPPSLTITLALWSSQNPTTWKDTVKRIGVLERNSATLRNLAAHVGLAKKLDLKIVSYFDFYPSDCGFIGMPVRIEFERGPNEDFLHSLFHVLQLTGNDRLADVVESNLAEVPRENVALAQRLVDDLRRGNPIAGRLSDGHYTLGHANFPREAVERALGLQPASTHQPPS